MAQASEGFEKCHFATLGAESLKSWRQDLSALCFVAETRCKRHSLASRSEAKIDDAIFIELRLLDRPLRRIWSKPKVVLMQTATRCCRLRHLPQWPMRCRNSHSALLLVRVEAGELSKVVDTYARALLATELEARVAALERERK
jgi:hypothetical protein